MKKIMATVAVLLVMLLSALPVYAEEGRVTYSGLAGEFIFAPGSEYSPTDLFPDFKDVMPGDTLTQRITVKNDATKEVKVKIYLRSLGANADSEAFLSQLGLRVKVSEENETPYMFDATAAETAQLTDWVCLGTLYSGGEVNLDVTLTVPVELDNEFQEQVGYLTWEFKIEELPVDPDDPVVPPTGDGMSTILYTAAVAGALLVLLLVMARRKKTQE
jgi:hypothetical protein